MSVINNTRKPKSTLKMKSNAICYHAVRESVTMAESLTAYIKTTEHPTNSAIELWLMYRSNDTWWTSCCMTFLMTMTTKNRADSPAWHRDVKRDVVLRLKRVSWPTGQCVTGNSNNNYLTSMCIDAIVWKLLQNGQVMEWSWLDHDIGNESWIDWGWHPR